MPPGFSVGADNPRGSLGFVDTFPFHGCSSLHLCTNSPSFKDTSHRVRTHCNLTASLKALFPNKGMFIGTAG